MKVSGKKFGKSGGGKRIALNMQPVSQCFDCSGCGDCCRGRFAIIITEADKDRIAEQAWTDEELKLGGKSLFTRRPDGYQLAHRADGSCVFLNEAGLCSIHAKYGAAAKPLPCRLYPFNYVPLGNQVRVDIRFDCPTAAANKGRAVSVHRPELQELVKKAVPERAATMPVPPFHGGLKLTWDELGSVTQAFERVLTDVSLDITRRVAASVKLVDLMRQAPAGALQGPNADEFLDMAAAHVQEEAGLDALFRVAPGSGESLSFRQTLGAYARIDRVGAKMNLSNRLRTGLRMFGGSGAVPSLREDFPDVAFADMEASRGVPTGEAALALERYLEVHLSSMGFFGESFYGRNYLDGMNALLLTYPLLCWFARAFAVAEGLETLNASCVERAMSIVDHNHGVTPALDVPTERFRTRLLCEAHTLRTLVVWYGS